MKNLIMCFVFGHLTFGFAFAQSKISRQEVFLKLTGNNIKEWIEISSELTLGSTCKSGQTLIFNKKIDSVQHKICINKEWQVFRYKLVLYKNGKNYNVIKLGEKEFLIDFIYKPINQKVIEKLVLIENKLAIKDEKKLILTFK